VNADRKDEVSADLGVDEFAGDKLVFIDFTKTVADQKEQISKLEELIRELVKFSGHDGACAELGQRPARSGCTCGIRKLYERIDDLME
jgi:hypothetical protein